MNEIFAYIDEFMVVYLDDILTYSKTWEEHVKHQRKVLQRLREIKFYGKLNKCVFGVDEVRPSVTD